MLSGDWRSESEKSENSLFLQWVIGKDIDIHAFFMPLGEFVRRSSLQICMHENFFLPSLN